MEKNTVSIQIYGNTYTLRTDNDPDYMDELAEKIDKNLKTISVSCPALSMAQCAVLCALDQADECQKAAAAADNLRAQIKDYLADSQRSRMEADVAHREIDRLNREIETLRQKLANM